MVDRDYGCHRRSWVVWGEIAGKMSSPDKTKRKAGEMEEEGLFLIMLVELLISGQCIP